MKVKVIAIAIRALRTITKLLIKGQGDLKIRGQVETLQTTALFRILRRVLKTWGDSIFLKLQRKKPSANAAVKKNSQRSKIILIIIVINHISECSKLAQKEYKARHDWVGKGIHREMCKKFKFDHANKNIYTTQHLSLKMTHTNSYGTLIHKRIT